jgi:hypothetical protein
MCRARRLTGDVGLFEEELHARHLPAHRRVVDGQVAVLVAHGQQVALAREPDREREARERARERSERERTGEVWLVIGPGRGAAMA